MEESVDLLTHLIHAGPRVVFAADEIPAFEFKILHVLREQCQPLAITLIESAHQLEQISRGGALGFHFLKSLIHDSGQDEVNDRVPFVL